MAPVFAVAGILLCAAAFFAVRRLVYSLIDRRIERFQSGLIEKQVVEIENMYRQVRGWRHDYRNHIQNMKIQLHEKNYAGLDEYLDGLEEDLAVVDTTIKTGNVMADAILNSKLSVAEKLQVRLKVRANIPGSLPITDVELCAVLGNLLDNATEACAGLPQEERFLRVYIGRLKNQLYISVQNSAGELCRENGIYRSTKPGEHGYGIFRIDRIAKKYGGCVNRQSEEGVFATELLLPLG
ncbi:MAG: ATP-binding protein [Lachnospiraceae bacterium]|nr:ATP-binding protein [Lachnospiraceae bacterium]